MNSKKTDFPRVHIHLEGGIVQWAATDNKLYDGMKITIGDYDRDSESECEDTLLFYDSK